MKHTSTVVWKDSGKEVSRHISTQDYALEKVYYEWDSCFENSNSIYSEELIAAAHAACFTVKLRFLLNEAGFIPAIIKTTSEVRQEKNSLCKSHLFVRATVPGLSSQKFQEYADNANINCLVSKAFNMSLTMEAILTEKIMA